MSSEKKEQFLQQLRQAEGSLARRDAVMRRLVGHYGPCAIRPHQRYFETLVKSIVSQQLSTRAAETIFTRFRQLYPGSRIPKAELLLSSTDEELRGVGLSFQKIGYIRDLAARVAEGRLRLSQLPRLSVPHLLAGPTRRLPGWRPRGAQGHPAAVRTARASWSGRDGGAGGHPSLGSLALGRLMVPLAEPREYSLIKWEAGQSQFKIQSP